MSSALPLSPLERLPSPLLGITIHHLNILTGSEGILNKADIPVIMRYTRALACTSKKMHQAMNSLPVTDALLTSLSKKYLQLPKYFVTPLDTPGARRWLWTYIETRGYQQTDQIIQSICDIIADIKCEVSGKSKDADLLRRRRDSLHSFLSTSPCTQSGYFLQIDREGYSIITPLGEKSFTISKLSPTPALSRLVIERLNAKLYNPFQRLYAITNIAGQILPPPHRYLGSRVSDSHQELISSIYTMLEIHRLGRNPIEKPLNSNRRWLSASSEEKSPFTHVTDLIPWGIDIARRLAMQPLAYPGTQKLSLESMEESFLFSSLHQATGATNIRQSSLDGHDLYLKPSDSPLDFEQLTLSYKAVLDNLQSNWIPALLKNYPDVLILSHTKSEEDFALFIKAKPYSMHERSLLYRLAKFLGIPRSHMDCGFWDTISHGHRHPTPPPSPDIFYMWIRKESIKRVMETLGIIF